MTARTGFLIVVLLFAGSALPAGQLPTQSAPEETPSAPVFGDVIDVRVVNLEAVVTDREGNRIHDLAPEDFRLLVDFQTSQELTAGRWGRYRTEVVLRKVDHDLLVTVLDPVTDLMMSGSARVTF
jgi:hypothetical protein